MTHFKNHNQSGFTLIEIILALFMVAMLLSSILNLQELVFSSVVTSSRRLHRLFMIKEYLFNRILDESKDEKETKKIEKPETTIEYKQRLVEKKSSLAKLQSMVQQTTQAQWKDNSKDREYTLINFVYNPEFEEGSA